MKNDYYDFYGGEETGEEEEFRDREKGTHVLTELISLIRSALNILELVYDHYNKKGKEK